MPCWVKAQIAVTCGWALVLVGCGPSDGAVGEGLEDGASFDVAADVLVTDGPVADGLVTDGPVSDAVTAETLGAADSDAQLADGEPGDAVPTCVGFCGDGVCDLVHCQETVQTCSADCAVCGNKVCEFGETPVSCPADCCGVVICGDGTCAGGVCGETLVLCPADCAPVCGNQLCEKGESPGLCAADCALQVCGNGVCEPTDGGPSGCPVDCATPCGNCLCDKGESPATCPMDCALCGDEFCSQCPAAGETATSCAADCAPVCAQSCDDGNACTQNDACTNGQCVGTGTCPDADASGGGDSADGGAGDSSDGGQDSLACACGDGTCEPECGETVGLCPADCKACGDGVCAPGESPTACFIDCCGYCGDGKCKGYACGESPSACTMDCGTACGNSTCDKGESPALCPVDCAVGACGNGVCEPTDGGPALCPGDCGTACGNCVCDSGEDFVGCPGDCGWCGDGVCSPCAGLAESAAACPGDCAAQACVGGCNDTLACTTDSCGVDGVCVHIPNESQCSDANPCTTDACDLAVGCTHVANANACDDGNPCTSGDVCWQTVCAGSGTCADVLGGDALGSGDSASENDTETGDTESVDTNSDAATTADGSGDANCLTSCGDKICACEETPKTCPGDCMVCGDGLCTPGEGPKTCAIDCCGGCGDGVCKGYDCGESPSACPVDCGKACGNQICEKSENPEACPEDCKHSACGNNVCEPTDGGPGLCPVDCGTACGDCVCEPGESWVSCPVDCGWCGDGICSNCSVLGEKGGACPADCPVSCDGGCDDGSPCTIDACGPGGCEHVGTCDLDLTFPFAVALPGGVTSFSFEAVAGQRFAMDLPTTAGDWYALLTVDQPLGAPQSLGPHVDGAFVDTVTVTSTGLHTLHIKSLNSTLPNGTAILHEVPPDDIVPALPDGPSVTVGATVVGQNFGVTWQGAPGLVVAVRSEATIWLCGLSTRVIDPDGLVLKPQSCTGGTVFLEGFNTPKLGKYTFVVDPSAKYIGESALNVYAIPGDVSATAVQTGPPATVTTTAPAQNAKIVFEGTLGDRVGLLFADTLGVCELAVDVLGPDGKSVFIRGCFGGNQWSDLLTLGQTGTYTVVLNLSGMKTGTIDLSVLVVPADLVATTAIDAPPATLQIAAPGQNATLSFEANAGTRIGLLTSTAWGICNVSVRLVAPDGTSVAYQGCFGGTNFMDVIELPVDGTYTYQVDPGGTGTGTMNLEVYTVPPDITGELVLGAPPMPVALGTPGQNASLTVSVTAGTGFDLVLNGTMSYCKLVVTVLDPNGKAVLKETCVQPNATLVVPTPTVSGTYTVLLDPATTVTGAVQIQAISK